MLKSFQFFPAVLNSSFVSPLKLLADPFCAANEHFRCPAWASDPLKIPSPCAGDFLFLPSQPASSSPVRAEAVPGWDRSTRAPELIVEVCLYHVIWLLCGTETVYCSIIKFIRKTWETQWELCVLTHLISAISYPEVDGDSLFHHEYSEKRKKRQQQKDRQVFQQVLLFPGRDVSVVQLWEGSSFPSWRVQEHCSRAEQSSDCVDSL